MENSAPLEIRSSSLSAVTHDEGGTHPETDFEDELNLQCQKCKLDRQRRES